MATAVITNPSIEPTTMPWPFTGVLAGKQSIRLNLSAAAIVALLGGAAAAQALLIADSAIDSGPYNTEFLGVTGSAAQTVGGAMTVTGILTTTAAQVQDGGVTSPISGAHNIAPATATSGTDTAFANGTQFLSSLLLPANKTITGVRFLVGSVGGTDKVYVVLYDSTGAVLANSSLTAGGATAGTAAQLMELALTATYAAKGARMFYVGISANGATAKLRTVPAYCGGAIYAGSVAQVHGTVAAITPPTTFTADKAPYLLVY